MSPGPIRFGHQATVSSADGPGSRLWRCIHRNVGPDTIIVIFFVTRSCLNDIMTQFVFCPSTCAFVTKSRNWVQESMPICLEFSTLKSFDNFPNVLSVNALLHHWRRAFTLKTFGKLSKLFSVLNSWQMGIDSFTQYLRISLPCDSWLSINSRPSHPKSRNDTNQMYFCQVQP